MMRISILALVVLATYTPLVTAAGQAETRPNVIILLADDLGWGDLGCYGHPAIKTPNLDQLAQQGLRFTNGYSAGAVCSPSRSAILTGRTPYRNGVFTWIPENSQIHLRASEVTLATLLRRAGYATCHVGKWHLNAGLKLAKQPQPGDHGYDHWFATQNNAVPSHRKPVNFIRNGVEVGATNDFSAQVVVGEAVDWLTNKRDKKKPFFMTVWFHEPHLPIEGNPKFLEMYPEQLAKDADLAQHHADVTQMDHAVGLLLKKLQDLGLDQSTLIVFTSDNGPEGDGKGADSRLHRWVGGRKRAVYEGGIRVPGIVRLPGSIPVGKTSDVPVIGSDLLPTICEIVGITPPKDRVIDGVSLVPLIRGDAIERKRPLYWRSHLAPGEFKVAMRQGDWTLLANVELSKFELYNLKNDPGQTTNLSSKEAARLQTMRDALTTLHHEIEAEGPTWWKGYSEKKKKGK